MEPDGAQTTNQTQTESLSSSPNTVSPVPLNNLTSAPRFGTVTPNRIFVGGIDFKATLGGLDSLVMNFVQQEFCVESLFDLLQQLKRYGFVTFETQEDAQKILQEAKKLNYKDKKLNIGPAIRKQQIRSPRSTVIPEAGTMYLTTSSGYPYIYHNGVAYFHTSEAASVPQPWPSRSVSSSPMMVAQPIYQSPTYHYQVPTQCLPSQWQWSVPQSPASSPSFLYLQPSEVIYQPIGITQENGCIPPPLLVEAAVPELYSDHGVQAPHHQPYTQSAMAMPAPEPRLHSVRRNFSFHSSVSLKPQYTRSPHFHPRKDYRMEDKILMPPSTDSLSRTSGASSNPEVIKINSVLDIASKVEDYYSKGYVVGAVHPIILPIGRRRNFPASHMYRVVLSRLKLSQKHAAPRGQRHPRLVIEECPLMYETLTNEVVKELLEKVNEAAKRGKKFVGFVTQHFPQTKACNGTSTDGSAELESTLGRRNREHRRKNSDENYKNWSEGTLSGHSSESGIEEEMQEKAACYRTQISSLEKEFSPVKSQKGDDKLYTVFNVFDDDSTCWSYHEGVLSMKVSRKGPVISTLEADWLELTTFYYKQGLSLIDSFVHWETSKGDYLPKSLEGLFIYEEEGAGVPGSNRKGNDAIVVEQWTVIEGCEIKTDYGPLLHTLAEFGWLLTCVLPTPIVRHDSEGNLATKQVVFLQRPVMWNSAVQTPEKKSLRQVIGEEKGKVSSRSVGLDTATSRPVEIGQPPDEFHLSPSKQCWIKEGSSQYGGFPGFSSSDGVLRELDDGQFDQEDGVTQVTCM